MRTRGESLEILSILRVYSENVRQEGLKLHT